jgi:hypothetical protein
MHACSIHEVMAHRLPVSLFLFGASLAAFGPGFAQAPPTAPAGPATSPAVTSAAPAAPASDTTAPTQSPAPPSAPTATPTVAPTEPAASPAPAAPAGPSAETLKKARMAGYHPETKKGVTMYCQETANIGTRFPTKKCLNEQQLNGVVDIQHQQQDSMRKPINCTGGPGCGSG